MFTCASLKILPLVRHVPFYKIYNNVTRVVVTVSVFVYRGCLAAASYLKERVLEGLLMNLDLASRGSVLFLFFRGNVLNLQIK